MDSSLAVFTLSTAFKLVETIRTSDQSSMRSIALSQDGNYIAIGYNSGRIEVSSALMRPTQLQCSLICGRYTPLLPINLTES